MTHTTRVLTKEELTELYNGGESVFDIKIDAKEQRLNSELAVFWNEISNNLPKSLERSALGDEKIFLAFKSAYPKIRECVFKAGQQDMLERVRGVIPKQKEYDGFDDSIDTEFVGFNTCREQTLKALDNLN